MDVTNIIVGAVGIVLMVFIPGYCLTLALFAKKELDFVEMAGISFILGFTPVFLLYAFNKNLGIPIDSITNYIILIFICLMGIGVWYKRKEKPAKSSR